MPLMIIGFDSFGLCCLKRY